MTAPTPAVPSFTDGQALIRQNWLDLATNVDNLGIYTAGGYNYATKPLMVAYVSATPTPTVGNATDTLVNFQIPIANTDNIWLGSRAAGTSPGYQIVTAGWYRISLQLHYGNEANGIRCARILVNGTSATANSVASDVRAPVTVNEGTVLFCSTLQHLNAGATVYGSTWQNSGTLNLRTDFSSSFLSLEWVAPY